MKKKFKNLYYRVLYRPVRWIQKKIDRWAERRYQEIVRKEEFILGFKAVTVKKGKIKYTLLFFQTPKGQVRFNLGRHFRGRNFSDQIMQQWI